MNIYNGQLKYFGQRILKDLDATQIQVTEQFSVPHIQSSDLPPPFISGEGGGLAYDVTTKMPWYSDGVTWKPIMSALPPGNAQSYSFIAGANQIINPNIITPLTMWTIAGPAPIYTTLPQWNLATGIYTATQTENLYISIGIAWAAGISNLGDRYLRLEYQASGGGGWIMVAESSRQAEPKTNVETSQTYDMNLLLNIGDQVRITVLHTAPANLQIAGGVHSYVSGFRIG